MWLLLVCVCACVCVWKWTVWRSLTTCLTVLGFKPSFRVEVKVRLRHLRMCCAQLHQNKRVRRNAECVLPELDLLTSVLLSCLCLPPQRCFFLLHLLWFTFRMCANKQPLSRPQPEPRSYNYSKHPKRMAAFHVCSSSLMTDRLAEPSCWWKQRLQPGSQRALAPAAVTRTNTFAPVFSIHRCLWALSQADLFDLTFSEG